jgi:hypothetical protein
MAVPDSRWPATMSYNGDFTGDFFSKHRVRVVVSRDDEASVSSPWQGVLCKIYGMQTAVYGPLYVPYISSHLSYPVVSSQHMFTYFSATYPVHSITQICGSKQTILTNITHEASLFNPTSVYLPKKFLEPMPKNL